MDRQRICNIYKVIQAREEKKIHVLLHVWILAYNVYITYVNKYTNIRVGT